MAEAEIPFPLLCMRPILMEIEEFGDVADVEYRVEKDRRDQ